MTNEKPKIFDDFYEVNCNECARYWDSSCDGVPKNEHRPCNSYKATRSVVIPEQIEELKKRIRSLAFSCLLLAIACVLHFGEPIVKGLIQWLS